MHAGQDPVDREARTLIRNSLGARKETTAPVNPLVTSGGSHQELDQLIQVGNYAVAIRLLGRLNQVGRAPELTQPQLGKLIRDLLTAQKFESAIPFLTEHIERFGQGRIALQLNLAKVLLHLERPHRAASVLTSIDRLALNTKETATWQKLAFHAQRQIDSGVIELSD